MNKAVTTLVTVGLMVLGAGPVLADAGAPGTTFPEQPSGPGVQVACTQLASNAGFPQRSTKPAPVAITITVGVYLDACAGG